MPATTPMTMPAMAPLDREDVVGAGEAVEEEVGEEVGSVVEERAGGWRRRRGLRGVGW